MPSSNKLIPNEDVVHAYIDTGTSFELLYNMMEGDGFDRKAVITLCKDMLKRNILVRTSCGIVSIVSHPNTCREIFIKKRIPFPEGFK